MFNKVTLALAFAAATASVALAATKQQSSAPRNDVYDSRGIYVGSDPDPNVRFDLQRDWDHGK